MNDRDSLFERKDVGRMGSFEVDFMYNRKYRRTTETANQKMKLGRPPLLKAQKKAQITGVRLRGEERGLLEKAAKMRGQKLSEWMRTTLVSAAISTVNQ